MKSLRTKVEDFLGRVPTADTATIAKALRLREEDVQNIMNTLALDSRVAESRAAGRIVQLVDRERVTGEFQRVNAIYAAEEAAELAKPTLRQLFETFTAAATEAASTRPPMRQTDALTSLQEMAEMFDQMLLELGDGAQ